ncbi:hypothetical protein ACWEOE_18045 [Amycolatopsis sp. NPDC004368]
MKGVGAAVIVGVLAVIANAVFNAIGVRATDLPIISTSSRDPRLVNPP